MSTKGDKVSFTKSVKGKDYSKMSMEEKQALLEKLEGMQKRLMEKEPYWFFEPTSGDVTDRMRELLGKYLKPEDIPQRVDGQLDAILSDAPIRGISGGNRCLGGESIIFDPVAGKERRIDEITESFHVWAWDGEKRVIAKASEPFTKGEDDLYRVTLSNGQEFVASLSHVVLTPRGFCSLSSLLPKSLVYRPPSSLEPFLSTHGVSDLNFGRTIPDCQESYSVCCRPYDGQPRRGLSNGLNAFPSQVGVLTHTSRFGHVDVRANTQEDIRSYQSAALLSIQDVPHHHEGRAVDSLSHSSCIPCESVLRSLQADCPLPNALGRPLRSMCGFAPQANRNGNRSFSSSSNTSLAVIDIQYHRKGLKYDFTVAQYHNYILADIIHHNSGKTEIDTIDGIFKSTGELPQALELQKQHPHIAYIIERAHRKFIRGRVVGASFKHLHRVVLPAWQRLVPPMFLKNGKWQDSYSAQHDILTLYRGKEPCASVSFMTNEQNPMDFGGDDLDWCKFDEEPRLAIFKENKMRFGTAERLDMSIAWTPVNGLTWATDLFSHGILGEEEAKCNMQLLKLCSVSNPRINFDVIDQIAAESENYEELKMRLLGEFISLSGLVYGSLFNRSVHVIEPFPITRKDFVVYRGLDPHLVKPTVCVEVAVDRMGNEYVIGTYSQQADTQTIKKDLHERAKGYRLGRTRCDRSSDSTIRVLGDRNVMRELKMGPYAIPALESSDKFTGSIHAGVDEIKKLLKIDPVTKKPRLFIFNTPENRLLITAMQTMERDANANEEKKGIRDKIAEGKHDAHAALRYIHQMRLNWYPEILDLPEPPPVSVSVGY